MAGLRYSSMGGRRLIEGDRVSDQSSRGVGKGPADIRRLIDEWQRSADEWKRLSALKHPPSRLERWVARRVVIFSPLGACLFGAASAWVHWPRMPAGYAVVLVALNSIVGAMPAVSAYVRVRSYERARKGKK